MARVFSLLGGGGRDRGVFGLLLRGGWVGTCADGRGRSRFCLYQVVVYFNVAGDLFVVLRYHR